MLNWHKMLTVGNGLKREANEEALVLEFWICKGFHIIACISLHECEMESANEEGRS